MSLCLSRVTLLPTNDADIFSSFPSFGLFLFLELHHCSFLKSTWYCIPWYGCGNVLKSRRWYLAINAAYALTTTQLRASALFWGLPAVGLTKCSSFWCFGSLGRYCVCLGHRHNGLLKLENNIFFQIASRMAINFFITTGTLFTIYLVTLHTLHRPELELDDDKAFVASFLIPLTRLFSHLAGSTSSCATILCALLQHLPLRLRARWRE